MIQVDPSLSQQSRSDPTDNTSKHRPANTNGRYLHLVAGGAETEPRIGGEDSRGSYTDPADPAVENDPFRDIPEADKTQQMRNVESALQNMYHPEMYEGIPNTDLPERDTLTAPGETPPIDNYFTYKDVPQNPGEYNSQEYISRDGSNKVAPPILRQQALRYGRIVTGEPVALATGEYLETWRDFLVPADVPFDGARFMGLRLAQPEHYVGPLGPRQISAFDEIVTNPARGRLEFHQADGTRIPFKRPENVFPAHNAGYPHLELRAPWLRQLELRDRGLIKHFRQYDDGLYRLEKLEDRNGRAIIFTRDQTGTLVTAKGTNGLSLAFTNDTRGRRTAITLIGTDGSRLDLARYSYGARGHMTAADCAFGPSVRYEWDEGRSLLRRWHNLTKRSETTFTYDDDGRVVRTMTNGIWNGDCFDYDPATRRTVYRPGGDHHLAQHFAFDANDNLIEQTDALGHTIGRRFDAAGFETAVTDANRNTTTKAYDVRGHVSRLTDAEGRATSFVFGPHGALDMMIDGAGKIRRWNNDGRGNMLGATDAEGHETRFLRDTNGRLLSVVFADGAEDHFTYDAFDRLASVTDARGGTTRFAHDVFGRLTETVDALGHATTNEFAAGAGGFATPSAVTRPDGVRLERHYSAEGTLATVIDGERRLWRYDYGAFNLLQSIEDPGGGRLTFAYDGEGRLTGVTNQNGLTYDLIRDAAGRVIATDDFDGRRTGYRRDPGGRLIETTKPDGVRLAYEYDRSDRLTAARSYAADDLAKAAPLEEEHFWYDGRGLLTKASNRAALIEFEYDGNGQVVRETMNGRTIESRRDARGNRIERRIGDGFVKIARDPLGLVARLAIDDHAPLDFTRDAFGRETGRRSARGFRLDQSWDAVGNLKAQSAGAGLGELSGLTRERPVAASGTGAQRHYSWNQADAPTAIADLVWGATDYAYDANGQVAQTRSGDGLIEDFTYDPARNLAGAAFQGPGLDAGVSTWFNWQSSPGGVVQLARGPNGETVALTRDACGRVVERRLDRKGFRPKIWRYAWDARDQLVRCDTPEGETWFYRYDPFGRRLTKVRKLSERALAWTAQKHPELVTDAAREATKIWTWPEPPAGTGAGGHDDRPPVVGTHFLWEGDLLVEDAPLRLDGTVDWHEATRWHYEPDRFQPLARQTPDGRLFAIVNDHLGTPREMFDEAGDLVWAAHYSTWGLVRGVKRAGPPANDEGGGALYPRGGGSGAGSRIEGALALASAPEEAAYDCPIRFLNQWADEETGLYYNRFRFYDPVAGQFTVPDPLGLGGGFQPFRYVDTPTCFTDPLGLRQDRRLDGTFLSPNGDPSLPSPGKAFEAETAAGFQAKGDQTFRNVTIRDQSGKVVSYGDVIVVRNGTIRFIVETKSGDPTLSDGQAQVQDAIRQGNPLTLSGPNTTGMPGAGVPTTFPSDTFQVIRPGNTLP